jgi:hypothetical protein
MWKAALNMGQAVGFVHACLHICADARQYWMQVVHCGPLLICSAAAWPALICRKQPGATALM